MIIGCEIIFENHKNSETRKSVVSDERFVKNMEVCISSAFLRVPVRCFNELIYGSTRERKVRYFCFEYSS